MIKFFFQLGVLVLSFSVPVLPNGGAKDYPPIKVGEQVPDVLFPKVYNYPGSTLKLSDLRGKLVLLDFWSTWCGSCLEGFPKMDNLQQEFGDQIAILLINAQQTTDNIERVNKIFASRQKNQGYTVRLPYIIEDTILQRLFPHKALPHYVWIDKEGRLLATTNLYEVNHKNISTLLNGGRVDFHTKTDLIGFDKLKPLFIDNNGSPGNSILFRSTITSYIEGIGFGSGMISNEKDEIVRAFHLNSYLIRLYCFAYGIELFDEKQILLETSKDSLFRMNPDRSKMYSQLFCYELIAPGISEPQVFKIMQEDLERQFKVRVHREYRTMEVIELLKIKQVPIIKADPKTGNYPSGIISVKHVIALLNAQSKSFFISAHEKEEHYFIPSSNINKLDYDGLVQLLKKQGYELKKGMRPIEVVVFRDIL